MTARNGQIIILIASNISGRLWAQKKPKCRVVVFSDSDGPVYFSPY